MGLINKILIFVLLITFIMSKIFQTLQPNSVAPSLNSECDKPSELGFNFMEEKICNKCHLSKPINRFSYNKASNGKFYYELKCKDCRNIELFNNRILKNNVDIPDLDGEYWVPILNYDGHYLISNFWRINNFNLKLAMLAEPKKDWQIVRGHLHSTVWDGEETLFDMQYLALGVSPDEAFELSYEDCDLIEIGKTVEIFFAESVEEEQLRKQIESNGLN